MMRNKVASIALNLRKIKSIVANKNKSRRSKLFEYKTADIWIRTGDDE